ncbi:MAG: YncE family protein [Caldilineaceae bacterium]
MENGDLILLQRVATVQVMLGQGYELVERAQTMPPFSEAAAAMFAAGVGQMNYAINFALGELYRAPQPCSSAGMEYRDTFIRWLSQYPLVAACESIKWRNPTMSGVNQYLDCIGIVYAVMLPLYGELTSIQLGQACVSDPNALPAKPPEILKDDILYQIIDVLPTTGAVASKLEAISGVDIETGERLNIIERIVGVIPDSKQAKYELEALPLKAASQAGESPLWANVRGILPAYPGSIIPRAFEMDAGGRTFIIDPSGSLTLIQQVGKEMATRHLSGTNRIYLEQARLNELRHMLGLLAQTTIVYTPPAVVGTESAAQYSNTLGPWEFGIVRGSNGQGDTVYRAHKGVAAVGATADGQPRQAFAATWRGLGPTAATPVVAQAVTSDTLAAAPLNLVVDATRNLAYVANWQGGAIGVVDTRTFSTTVVGALGERVEGLAFNPVTNMIYAASAFDNGVTVIDARTLTTTAYIPVGLGPAALALDGGRQRLYSANRYSNSVSVINIVSNTVIAEVPVSLFPNALAGDWGRNRLYAANMGANSVSVIDTLANTEVATITVGGGPVQLAVNPATHTVYVASRDSSQVIVIDGATDQVVASVEGISQPIALVVDVSQNRVYVASQRDHRIYAIDGSSNTIMGARRAETPTALAVNAATGQLIAAEGKPGSLAISEGTVETWSGLPQRLFIAAILR